MGRKVDNIMKNSILKVVIQFVFVFIVLLITGYIIKEHDNIINSLVLAVVLTGFNLLVDKIQYKKKNSK